MIRRDNPSSNTSNIHIIYFTAAMVIATNVTQCIVYVFGIVIRVSHVTVSFNTQIPMRLMPLNILISYRRKQAWKQ